jgi:hypothetical protein
VLILNVSLGFLPFLAGIIILPIQLVSNGTAEDCEPTAPCRAGSAGHDAHVPVLRRRRHGDGLNAFLVQAANTRSWAARSTAFSRSQHR